MIVGYLGNFGPAHSTENHVALSLESLGHDVVRIQEGDTRAVDVPGIVRDAGCDMFLWTQTYGLAVSGGSIGDRFQMLDRLREAGVPSAGFHLDKWWGLSRADQLEVEPFFRVDHLFTADGGHDDDWAALGINHHWLPPGVFHGECEPGTFTPKYASDVAFVGSWRGGYHAESTHRAALVSHLAQRWRRHIKFWPRGGPAVRGAELRNLYASCKIVVGDSCLVPNAPRYWSDRIPETLGRGGFLLHPKVEGLNEHFQTGIHLDTWDAFDWDALDSKIELYLDEPAERAAIALGGREHTVAHHTYANRAQSVIDAVLGEREAVA